MTTECVRTGIILNSSGDLASSSGIEESNILMNDSFEIAFSDPASISLACEGPDVHVYGGAYKNTQACMNAKINQQVFFTTQG